MKKFAFKLLSLICCLCFIFPCFTACNKEKESEPKYKLEDYFCEPRTDYYQSLAEMQTIRTTPYPVDEEPTLKVAFGLQPKPDTKVKITKITGTAFYACSMYEHRSHEFNAFFFTGENLYIKSTISIFDKDDEVMLGTYHHETNFTISQEIILSGPEIGYDDDDYEEILWEQWDVASNTISFKIYDVPNIDTDIYFNITNLKVWFEPIV